MRMIFDSRGPETLARATHGRLRLCLLAELGEKAFGNIRNLLHFLKFAYCVLPLLCLQ
jgi:hypothetical protein